MGRLFLHGNTNHLVLKLRSDSNKIIFDTLVKAGK